MVDHLDCLRSDFCAFMLVSSFILFFLPDCAVLTFWIIISAPHISFSGLAKMRCIFNSEFM